MSLEGKGLSPDVLEKSVFCVLCVLCVLCCVVFVVFVVLCCVCFFLSLMSMLGGGLGGRGGVGAQRDARRGAVMCIGDHRRGRISSCCCCQQFFLLCVVNMGNPDVLEKSVCECG